MRKLGLVLLAISIILLMVSPSFAQVPREAVRSEGKTGFTNVAVRGFNRIGQPGYIEMTNGDGNVYYLYIGTDGHLRLASDNAVGTISSPSIAAWEDGSGITVGQQIEGGI